ncbi:ester cyclase [Streptomyces coelicoflavus]|uniref:ester cyclase n=1 Tax=Streptomyces coelicoflavus TaxID=285562 RepID=UPI0036B22F41
MNATANSVDPVDVARAAFRSVATGHLDHFTELLHEDVVYDVVPVGLRRGRQAVRRYFEEVRLAMPDLVMAMENAVGDDRYAAVEWRMTGTFDGAPYQGLSPTKRHIALPGVDFVEVDAGRIRRSRTVFDGAELGRQIGLLPSRDSAADRAATRAFNVKTQLTDRWRERHARQRSHAP